MRTSLLLAFLSVSLSLPSFAADSPPAATISNGPLEAQIYLPDAARGFYRGTRFDWSGVVNSLKFSGHEYYGPWFTKTDPTVHDFVYLGAEIVAGPCSAITGPVDEFKPIGWDEAKPGSGNFVKIGIGALRKPAGDSAEYDHYRVYDVVNPGKWRIKKTRSSIEFIQTLKDASSGVAYVYRKTIQLTPGKPEMQLRHSIKNTGTHTIQTDVYNHNFLVLDGKPTVAGVSITVPFEIQSPQPRDPALAEVRGHQIIYRRNLVEKETVSLTLGGFSDSVKDHQIRIENPAAHAGMSIASDRPLSKELIWSIRSVVAVEPYVAISIEPGQEFSWTSTYSYFTLP